MASDALFFVGHGGNGLEALAADLRGAAASLMVEAPPTLERIGNHIERNARAIASGNGSTSIPGSIRGGLNGPLEYRIQAGDDATPLAGLWELGNKGRGRSGLGRDWFVHPTFGNAPWVEQARYPFLRPALSQDRAAITTEMELMWDRALTPWRLHPSSSSLGGSEVISTIVGTLA